ncbi:MAG: hypothetical protein V2A78_06450 [bacterium]
MNKNKKIIWTNLVGNVFELFFFKVPKYGYNIKSQCMLEIDRQGYMKWSRGKPWGLAADIYAFKINQGHALLFRGEDGVCELNEVGKIIWEYKGDGKTTLCPVFAQRIENIPFTEVQLFRPTSRGGLSRGGR